MGSSLGQIELFHKLYLICAACAFAMLAVLAVLFIRLDVQTAIVYFIGIKRRREIQKLEYAPTDSKALSAGEEDKTSVMDIYGKTDVLYQEKRAFSVEKEILIVHTDEVV